MRLLLFLAIIFLTEIDANAQIISRHAPVYSQSRIDLDVNDYIYDHFEIGGGGHIFIAVPGAYAKLRYAPINYQRIKLMGEIRGEIITAPVAGWNYNVKLGTGFDNGVGIHAGFGRSHYVSRRRISPTEFETVYLYQNSFEFGMRWEGMRRQYDIWATVPLNRNYAAPVFAVGISFTAGGLWDFNDQKWFLPKRK